MTPAARPGLQALLIVFAVAFTASRFDFVFGSLINEIGYRLQPDTSQNLVAGPSRTILDIGLLIFGLLLVAGHPHRSGITLGTGRNRGKAIAVCAIVIGGAAAYRFALDGTAFDNWNASWSTWVISPIAQELIFSGFILGLLDEHFPRWWHRSIPISTAVVVSALLFGMWHFIPDFIFAQRELDYVAFRLAYTAGGWVFYAMTRLWTGTILYAIIMHMAVNFIALGL